MPKTEAEGSAIELFDAKLNEQVSVGGNFRFVSTTTFREGKDDSGFDVSGGNLYLEVAVVEDFLGIYVDEQVAPGGALSREAFALVRGGKGYLKAGRFLLPYGLRIVDDDAFVRRVTGFNFDSQDHGLEIGIEPGPLSLALALTNGTQGGKENNRAKQVSFVGSTVHRSFRLGASFSWNEGPEVTRKVAGAFAGLNAGRLTLLGEIDVIRDEAGTEPEFGNQRLAYAEADLLLGRGISLRLAGDYWDPFSEIAEDERTTLRLGIEPFIGPFLQVCANYRFRSAPPQLEAENEDGLAIELHAFF